MALSNSIKVQMPKEKITFKKGKGDTILEFPLKISHTKLSKITHTFIPKSSLFCLILVFFVLFS